MASRANILVIILLTILVAVMAGMTLLVFVTMKRFEVASDQILVNPGFEMAGDELMFDEPIPPGWERRGRHGSIRFRGDRVVLDNDQPQGSISLLQLIDVPPDIHAYELTATIELQLAIGGAESWNTARVDLVSIMPDGKPAYNRPHKLFDTTGTRPSYTYRKVLEVAPGAPQVRLAMFLNRTTGRMIVSGLALRPAYERAEFTHMSTLVRTGWLALLLIGGAWFIAKAAHKPAASGAVAVVVLGAALAIMPYELKDPLLEALDLGGSDASEREWSSRALHVLGFFILGFLVRLARRRDHISRVLVPMVALTLLTELLQAMTTGIGADDLIDVAANLAGTVVGLGLGQEHVRRYYRKRHRRKRRRKSRSSDAPLDAPSNAPEAG